MTIGRIPSVEGGIQPTIVDAKGDILTATAADTPAVLAVGNNGETLVADSSQTTGLRWAANYGFTAGKNKIINGDFNINQRSFSSTGVSDTYGFDRWLQQFNGGTCTYSSQAFTLGTAPVAGYESKNFARLVTASQSAAGDYAYLVQRIEDVRTFANQTVNVSFWAKAASGTPKVTVEFSQYFGSGGSPSATARNYIGQVTLSTSWTRYSVSASIASVSGKTLGTTNDSWLGLYLWTSAGTDFNARTNSMGIQNTTIDFWGVQVEAGSVATAFQTATGTLAGELAACERYFQSFASSDTAYSYYGVASYNTTTQVIIALKTKTTMRGQPAITFSGNADFIVTAAGAGRVSSATGTDQLSRDMVGLTFTTAAGTAGQAAVVQSNNKTTAYIWLSAEL